MVDDEKRVRDRRSTSKKLALAAAAIAGLLLLSLFFYWIGSELPGSVSGPNLGPADVTVRVNTSAPTVVNKMAFGATITQDSRALFTDKGKQLLRSSLGMMNVQIMGWGADNPEPSPGEYSWKTLDQRVQLMRATGSEKMITFCCAPDWMKGGDEGDTDWSELEMAPLPSHYDDYAKLAQRVAQRYPDVQYFQVWNELKGFWNDSKNRWDYEGYTTLYNKVYHAVKEVRPDAKIGGPYVVVPSSSHYPDSQPAINALNKRALDVISYWLAHKDGGDFIVLDGGPSPEDEIFDEELKNEFAAGQYFIDVATWVQKQPNAQGLAIGWAEWYPAASQKWDDLQHINAVVANDMIYTMNSGAAYALMWGAQGDNDGIARPLGIMDKQGQPTPLYDTARAVKEAFPPGTQLYHIEVSRPEMVIALASRTQALLVNKTDQALTVDVNNMRTTLDPYQVSALAFHGT